ncbi:MAG TPA: zf-HC2 domain-containing protein, partial [Polyangiales bacterium]|nr:zf-HC2 domain-containing protein [Polyangiales bacterium]
TFDAWSSGELDAQLREQAQAHVATCERCRLRHAELEGVRKEFYAAAPSFSAHAQRTRPKHVSKWVFSLALAAAVALIFTPGVRPGTRQKGGPSLGYFVKRGEQVFEGARDTALQPGDLIRFTFSSHEPRYLALFGWDSHTASVYFPANSEHAERVQSQMDVGLDFSVELDAAQSDEQVHALFCKGSYELRPLVAALQDTGQLPVPPDCQKVNVTLHKALPQ